MSVLKAVGWYEIGAGMFGVTIAAWSAYQPASNSAVGNTWLGIACFATLIVGGVRLVRGDAKGTVALLVMNAVQVFFFSIDGAVWRFTSGLQLSVAVDNQSPQFFAGLAATFLVGVRSYAEPFLIGINIVPTVLIGILLVSLRRERREVSRSGF